MDGKARTGNSAGSAPNAHGDKAAPPAGVITSLLTAVLHGASSAGLGDLLAGDTVRCALGAVEKSLVDLATSIRDVTEAQAQQSIHTRARTSSGPHGAAGAAVPTRAHTHACPGPSITTRLSLDAIRHVFSYVDTRRPSALTTLACVCKVWRDAIIHTEKLWTPAAHTLLPFTTQADNEAVKELLHAMGGCRELVLKYAYALTHAAITVETTRQNRSMPPEWSKQPFQVIFELHDRIGGGILMSRVGQAAFTMKHGPYNDGEDIPSLYVTQPSAVHQRPFTLSDLLLPWEQETFVHNLFSQRGRFLARFFVVSSHTGRLSLLHTTTPHDAFEGLGNDVKPYAMLPTPLACAVAMSTNLSGSFAFEVEEHDEEGLRWQVASWASLVLQSEGASVSAAIGDVLYPMLCQ